MKETRKKERRKKERNIKKENELVTVKKKTKKKECGIYSVSQYQNKPTVVI